MKWAYSITAFVGRIDLLKKSIVSLRNAGFTNPGIYIDGCTHQRAAELESELGLEVVSRHSRARHPNTGHNSIGPFGNFVLTLWETYLRKPHCDRYAIFQDDILACKGLKEFLSAQPYPDKGYWNLYTDPRNQGVCPRFGDKHSGPQKEGWYVPNYGRKGIGALGIVLDKAALLLMLSSRGAAEKPQNVHDGWRNLDGQIYATLDQHDYKEYVHNPSLLQHTGVHSTIGNGPNKMALSFRGEGWDAMTLIKK